MNTKFGIGAISLGVVFELLGHSAGWAADEIRKSGKTQAEYETGWRTELESGRNNVVKAIKENASGYAAFDSGSLGDGTLEMIPFVVFRALQEIEPGVLGSAALESNGFFRREDSLTGNNGISWTRPAAAGALPKLRYFTRTCAGCHTGRVRTEDGGIRVLNGGVNTEMNAHRFIGQLTAMLSRNLSTSDSSPQYQAFRKKLLVELNNHEPDWYWKSSKNKVTPDEAKVEVDAVVANIDEVLSQMRKMNDSRLAKVQILKDHTYSKTKNPPSLIGGAPGLVETSGLGAAGLITPATKGMAASLLPPAPAKADIPAVWKIDNLGYANWDATLNGFARALTSSLAVVGDPTKIDINQNVLIQEFLPKLPPEPFPFEIGSAAKGRGAETFTKNCQGCHESRVGRSREDSVFDIGTDPLRANAITAASAKIVTAVLMKNCPADVEQCKFKNNEVMVDPSPKRGYVAGPLTGVWAQAPYLHNGSIPTLRQLLVPELRTKAPFLRGSISYLPDDGGWEWDPRKINSLRKKGDVAIGLHDPREAGFGSEGHGSIQNQFAVDGKGNRVRIAWSNSDSDRRIVNDLIAYLESI